MNALAKGLLEAVHALDLPAVADNWQSGEPLQLMPSLDLAVIHFSPTGAASWANVLFSREHPGGVVADIDIRAGPVCNVRFDADQRDENDESIAWLPGSDWSQLQWLHLHGDGEHRFVAPYPASLLKLMVAVGVGMAVEAGHLTWAQTQAALETMIVVSDNDATEHCLALLHRFKVVDQLNRRFQQLGLHTLQLNGTRPDGGWRNADGAGVGQIHMTAWDTARLLWLLDTQAPPAPWLPACERLLRSDTCERLHAVLSRQERNEVLSSGSLHGVHGWLPGFPDAPAFAHKTGTTNNYASDAGILRTADTHAIVALITSLGRRYAPHERCATTWQLPALGAAVHRLLKETT